MALPDSCNRRYCSGQIKAKHQGICPTGWHLLSNADWNVLIKFINPSCTDDSNCNGAGTKLKATNGWNDYDGKSGNGEDTYGFSALPGGYGSYGGDISYFDDVGDIGYWLSASDCSGDRACIRGVRHEFVFVDTDHKEYLFSVRCLKD
jgi:uncharacterized protein (TIGR02145 family)